MASLDFQIRCRFMDNSPPLNLLTSGPPAGEGAPRPAPDGGCWALEVGWVGGWVVVGVGWVVVAGEKKRDARRDHYAARGAL